MKYRLSMCVRLFLIEGEKQIVCFLIKYFLCYGHLVTRTIIGRITSTIIPATFPVIAPATAPASSAFSPTFAGS